MGLDTGFRVFFNGTHAEAGSLSGWSRDTAYDDRYLSGAETGQDAGNTGGASTHNHTDSGHTHTGDAHTHDVSAADTTDSTQFSSGQPPGSACAPAAYIHGHSSVSSAAATVTYQSGTATFSAVAAHPPYYTLLLIKPDDGNQEVPDGGIILIGCQCGIIPAGYTKCDGTGGTPDLDSKFIRIADTGANAGGTGGSETHDHTAAAGHTHSVTAHTHAASTLGLADASVIATETSGTTNVRLRAHHHKSLSSGGSGTTSSASPTSSTHLNRPPCRRLIAAENTSGGASTPDGAILIWTGTRAGLPNGWQLCDGSEGTINFDGRQVEITTYAGLVGTGSAASNSHDHTFGHTHTDNAHNHSVGNERDIATETVETGSDAALSKTAHNHTWTVSSETPTMQSSGATTTSSADKRYLWTGVLFARKVATTVHIQGGHIKGADIAM